MEFGLWCAGYRHLLCIDGPWSLYSTIEAQLFIGVLMAVNINI